MVDDVDDDEAEEALFEAEMKASDIKICKYSKLPCDGLADDKGVVHCSVAGRSGGGFACLRIRLKGGQGYGMTLYEKLKGQGLLEDCNEGDK